MNGEYMTITKIKPESALRKQLILKKNRALYIYSHRLYFRAVISAAAILHPQALRICARPTGGHGNDYRVTSAHSKHFCIATRN